MRRYTRREFTAAIGSSCLVTAAMAAPRRGDFAPDEVGVDSNGERVSLATHAGKALVISFWATWCPYCLKELPILNNIQRAAGKSQMHVLAVNTESREVYRKVVRVLSELDIQVTHDSNGKGQAAFGVKGIPHMAIVGRSGRIISVYRGYAESSLDAITADINAALSPSS